MPKINDLKIDNSIWGNQILLEIKESYKYENGRRTGEYLGKKVTVACTGLALEKISVLIDDEVTIDFDNDSNDFSKIVEFEGLECYPYSINGNIGIKATAKSVRLKNQNSRGQKNDGQ
ncbi:hypothetical protein OKW22_000871 [Bacilli bacterium PM5-3]|nr:hypothetical protein [Bacilli bacterium PM5-3]